MKRNLIIGISVIVILIALVLVGYFYFNSSQEPKQLIGEEILEVKLTIDNGNSLSKIEVDLWKAGSRGVPNAGIAHTDDNGVAIFNIPEGEYEIGFNLNNFPDNLVYPEKTPVVVEKGIPVSKTIVLGVKQE